MTDEHGSESQPVHEDVPTEEHQTHEAEAGGWSDDHPPVDDFADPGSANEEMATASHEVAAETDETMSSSAISPSRSMLPLFAGIGGVLLVGAVVYWQFGHSSPPPVAMVPVSSPKSSLSVPLQTDAKSAAATTSTASQNMDIASLYKTAPESPPPMPPKEATPAAMPVTAITTAPETLSAAPSAPVAPASKTAPVTPVVAPAMPAALPSSMPSAPPANSVENRIDTISARIDTLQKSLNDATRQLNQLSNMVAATQAMPPVSNQTNPALEDRLNKIEQNLMQIEHNTNKAPPVLASPETAPAASVVRTVSRRTSRPAVKHTRHVVVHKKMKPRLTSSPDTIAMAHNSSPWILRAATPNEAWVSTNANSAELRHVQIGDSLSGIGQVRAIRQTMTGWEIEGTAGTVR